MVAPCIVCLSAGTFWELFWVEDWELMFCLIWQESSSNNDAEKEVDVFGCTGEQGGFTNYHDLQHTQCTIIH